MGILNIENLKFYIVLVNYCSGNGWIQLKMSPFIAKHSDQYACKSFKIDEPIYYIRRFVPKIDHSRVHHLLLFGCENKRFQSQDSVWDCDTHNFEAHRYRNIDSFTGPPCTGEGSILYAWTMNGTTFTLPDDVSFWIGPKVNINSLVIQIHYKDPFYVEDTSGLDVEYGNRTFKRGGVLVLSSNGFLRARSEDYFEIIYENDENIDLYPFAYRVHAHSLGIVNSAYHVYNQGDKTQIWQEIGRRSPQLPQKFTPTNAGIVVKKGDLITGICTMYNYRSHTVLIGSSRKDEMCNIYIMYWVYGKTILNKSYALAAGPPIEYFASDKRINCKSIPTTAYIEPPPPNGRENAWISDLYLEHFSNLHK